MGYTFADLVDIEAVQRLADLFFHATGMPSAVIDTKGVVLTESGWRRLCTDFHRVNPETRQRCVESDTSVANRAGPGGKHAIYRCGNGLIDAATPIIIGGEHVANLFTGQFFFEPPDMNYFREQGRRFGFAEAAYLDAVADVPVIEKARLQPFLDFFSEFAAMLGEMGLKQLRQIRMAAESRRYAMIAGNTRDIILFLRRDDGRILEANTAAENAYGYSRDELLALTIHDLRLRGSRPEVDFQMAEADTKGVLFETIHCRKDGSLFPVEVSSRGETIDGVRTLLSVVRDISERKRREERIARLTQLYSMLIRVNETIVRTDDQALLYREVCRIVGEEGSFPLVWIGEVDGGRVTPVASHGAAAGYLDEITVEVNGDFGRGPTGTCIRENRPVINDDFETNAATMPWREPALRRGLRTSAAFPLHRREVVVAALTIYALRPHDFDAEQVGLLQTLAADVSYALDTMEQERRRTMAETSLQHSLRRFELLAHTAEELLGHPDPQMLINSLCRDVMDHLGCQAFFNFLAVEETGRLRLNAYAGIPEEEARKIEWLDYGAAICGCAAQDVCRIVAEHVQTTPDPRTEHVRAFGIKAYACHPLPGRNGVPMGTLSFGTRERDTFSEDDLSLMKAVAGQVAVAMVRMKDEQALKKARDELDRRVEERTAELRQAYDKLMRETHEREKVEQQLRQSQKLEALGTLAGGIAHDFNNLLAAIMGFTELIKDHTSEEKRVLRYADRVLEAGMRGRELVRQMLTFSRQDEEEKKPLRLSGVVKESVGLLRASLPSTIGIAVDVESESGLIYGDRVQIQQVLMNLATNAAHAMREKGGILDIRLSDFSVGSSDGNRHNVPPGFYMRLTVRDTGVGIRPEIIDRIFDPFFTTKKTGEGTGLGLSVVLGIVRQSGGHVAVESEPARAPPSRSTSRRPWTDRAWRAHPGTASSRPATSGYCSWMTRRP